MTKRNSFAFLFFLLIIPGIASAQLRSQDPDKVNFPTALRQGYGQSGGLLSFFGLDPDRFSMTHSYSLAFMNVGGQGLSQGVYLNTMQYQVSDPLTVSVQWGVTHSPLPSQGAPDVLNSGFFVSGASVDYKPSKNFHVGIQYSSYPMQGRYRNPYGMGRQSLLNRLGEENQ